MMEKKFVTYVRKFNNASKKKTKCFQYIINSKYLKGFEDKPVIVIVKEIDLDNTRKQSGGN